MSDKPQYVTGFYFDEGRSSVVLIRKQKPDWQVGKLNGVGGKVEAGETPIDAMVREFREETGKQTHERDWRFFAVLRCGDSDVNFFESSGNFEGIRTVTDERVEMLYVGYRLPDDVIPNLKWLIPLALSNEYSMCIIQ